LSVEPADEVVKRLQDIFGIQTISPVLQVVKTLEAAQKGTVEIVRPVVEDAKNVKINTKSGDHAFEYDTIELNRCSGCAVATRVRRLDVKMKDPDLTVRTEIRNDGIYLSVETVPAAGGLPVGTAGKGMLMLSGRIDSPVAGYLSMKRGIEVEAVHFASPPY